jgi:hypothetical protein
MSWQRSCRRDAVAAGAGDRNRVLGGGLLLEGEVGRLWASGELGLWPNYSSLRAQ